MTKKFYKTNLLKVKKNDILTGNNYHLKFLDYFNFITLEEVFILKMEIFYRKKIFPKKLKIIIFLNT